MGPRTTASGCVCSRTLSFSRFIIVTGANTEEAMRRDQVQVVAQPGRRGWACRDLPMRMQCQHSHVSAHRRSPHFKTTLLPSSSRMLVDSLVGSQCASYMYTLKYSARKILRRSVSFPNCCSIPSFLTNICFCWNMEHITTHAQYGIVSCF